MKRLLLLLLPICLLLAGATGWCVVRYELIPAADREIAALRHYRPPTVTQIYDRHGQPLDTLYQERRFWVPLARIPRHVQQAVLAAEDRRFYTHPGVDWRGILRAAERNANAGTRLEGGSTLTQQLVKHLIVGHQRTYARKLREAFLAWRLEQQMSKQAILELYLNFVYLGEGNYGVEAAARDYFAKSAATLTVAEGALLAGLIPAPTETSPRRHPEEAKRQRDQVLEAMVATGFLAPEQGKAMAVTPITPAPRPEARPQVGNAYRSEVRRNLRRQLGEPLMFAQGLQVHTPYDPAIQAVAEESLRATAQAIEARQGHGGPYRTLGYSDWEMFFIRAPELERSPTTGIPLRPKPGDCFPAAFKHDKERIIWAGPHGLELSDASWRGLVRPLEPDLPAGPMAVWARAGHVYRVCMNEEGQVALAPNPWVQGAVVVLENASGGVVALAGGVDVPLGGFNRATQARRQPGSSFKPIVYAAALEGGHTQLDKVKDRPLVLRSGGARWQPHNYDGLYRGWIPIRHALAYSANSATVRLGLEVGADAVANMARRLGVKTSLHRDVTLPLGSSELTPLDLATAYATLARGGRAFEPVLVSRLTLEDGTEVGQAGEGLKLPGHPWRKLEGGAGAQVLDPTIAFQVVDMLQAATRMGPGRRAQRVGFPRAGKTGTSSNYADAWYVGMTPTHTVAVWVGSDRRVPLGLGESGGRAALPVWKAVVAALEGETPGPGFTPPAGMRLVRYRGERVALPATEGVVARRR